MSNEDQVTIQIVITHPRKAEPVLGRARLSADLYDGANEGNEEFRQRLEDHCTQLLRRLVSIEKARP